ncbi:MAG TPA: signal peptidase I [Pseudonocardia sp.]|nr:signal peptidase I [Pseudonocardia sp.]
MNGAPRRPQAPVERAAGPAGSAEADHPEPEDATPRRHRRRAGDSPDQRPAAGYAASLPAGRRPRTGRRRRENFWKELPLLVVVALLLTFVIQTFLAKVYVIPSGSMETTLHGCAGCDNDRVLVDKITYRLGEPQPGDVVVFRGPDSWTSEVQFAEPSGAVARGLQLFGSLIGVAPPDEKDFVKRVIAVGGQTISCCDARNRVLVDGQPLDEPYLYFAPELGQARQPTFGPETIPAGHLWLMGDSRINSADSRVPGHGPVPVENVIGQARMIVLPFTRFGWIDAVDPQTTAAAPAAPIEAPLALGVLGAFPVLAGGRRYARGLGGLCSQRRRRADEHGRFLPGR